MQQKGIALIPLIGLLVLLVLVVAGIWWWQTRSASTLGSQIYKEVQNSTKDEVTQSNPFSKVNPFKGVYKNPFE